MVPSKSDLLKTGVSGLDAILSGGIPRGNVILLEGAIGTGKTTMGAEFVYRGASEFGEPGVIVVFEVSPDKLARDMAGFGWDLEALEREQRLKLIYTTREVFRQELQQSDSMLLDEAQKIDAKRIFIDGAAGLLDVRGEDDSREAFHILAQGLQRANMTAMLALEADALDPRGYFRGSTTVVGGISGAVKSVMPLHYIAEDSRVGERSLLLSLDEQVPQVLRNAASFSIDLQPAIERCVVWLYYDAPHE